MHSSPRDWLDRPFANFTMEKPVAKTKPKTCEAVQLDEARARALHKRTAEINMEYSQISLPPFEEDDVGFYLEMVRAIREADDALGAVSVDRMALQDISQHAHCIAKAGPLAIDNLADAWQAFDEIHLKISRLLSNAAIRAGAIGGGDHG